MDWPKFYKVYLDNNYPAVPQFAMLARHSAHHPTPPSFHFNNLQIPPSQPSIRIPFIFIKIQIPFCATSLFSHRAKTPGVTTHCAILSHPSRVTTLPATASAKAGSQTTSHVFSRSCRLFGLSLQRFHPSFPLFSAAYRHFSADTGGATPSCSSRRPYRVLVTRRSHFFFVVSFCSTSGHFCMEER